MFGNLVEEQDRKEKRQLAWYQFRIKIAKFFGFRYIKVRRHLYMSTYDYLRQNYIVDRSGHAGVIFVVAW